MTQEQIAEGMDTTQSAVSRMERQDDMLVSTLNDYVAATGGTLLIVAVYPGGDVLPVTEPA